MSTTGVRGDDAGEIGSVDMKLEVVVIPVSEVDRAKEFYSRLGWRLDADFPFDNGFQDLQYTPPGSGGSIQFGADMTSASPGSARSYGSFATFSDPDGNGWLLEEVTNRLPGRVDVAETTFASTADLASALRRAAAAHGEHEQRTSQRDEGWPDWYAQYMAAEQAGEELPR
jgi:catechol 2,3-dioxygenase-like lactoylglutathione lyase family enzyme